MLITLPFILYDFFIVRISMFMGLMADRRQMVAFCSKRYEGVAISIVLLPNSLMPLSS